MIEPGIYPDPRNGIPGLSVAEYDAIDAVRSTTLNHLCDWRTPAHCRLYLDQGVGEKEALMFGTAYHTIVLEPEKLEGSVVEMLEAPKVGKGDRRAWSRDADKIRRDQWLSEQRSAGKIVVERRAKIGDLEVKPLDYLRRMRDALWANTEARALLTGNGMNEVSIVWDDELGLRCKARIDRIVAWKGGVAVIDVKSAKPPITPRAFSSTILQRGYHRQAATYNRALDSRFGPAKRPFFHVVQENVMPFAVKVYELGWDSIEIGMAEIETALQTYKRCEEIGEWPAYPSVIQPIELPAWRLQRPDEGAEDLL